MSESAENTNKRLSSIDNSIKDFTKQMEGVNKRLDGFDGRLGTAETLVQNIQNAPPPAPKSDGEDPLVKRLNQDAESIVKYDAAIKTHNTAIAGLKDTLCGKDNRVADAINQQGQDIGGIKQQQDVLKTQSEAQAGQIQALITAQTQTYASVNTLVNSVNNLNNKKADPPSNKTINFNISVPWGRPVTTTAATNNSVSVTTAVSAPVAAGQEQKTQRVVNPCPPDYIIVPRR
jgi:chromosome segregation ATPase